MNPTVGRIVRYFPTTTDGLATPDEGCAARTSNQGDEMDEPE